MSRETLKNITLSFVALFILSACSGGKSSNKTVEELEKTTSIPKCAKDKYDSSKAIKISKDTKILSFEDGTKVRVFHYSNLEKLVCVIKGDARIAEPKNIK